MKLVSVRDLGISPGHAWKSLSEEREMIITNNGRPIAVLTNVLVSALLDPNGAPASILNLVLNGQLQVLYDIRMVPACIEVLHRPKLGFYSCGVYRR